MNKRIVLYSESFQELKPSNLKPIDKGPPEEDLLIKSKLCYLLVLFILTLLLFDIHSKSLILNWFICSVQ